MKKNIYKKYRNFNEILDDKTEKRGECQIWTAGCHRQGYPMVRWEGKMVQVVRHRIAEELGRPLLSSERVRNSVCQNVKCVNTDHYQVHAKGTRSWGETGAWNTLEEKQAIRDLWFAQSLEEREAWGSQRRFAKKHNLNPASLRKVIFNLFETFDLD